MSVVSFDVGAGMRDGGIELGENVFRVGQSIDHTDFAEDPEML